MDFCNSFTIINSFATAELSASGGMMISATLTQLYILQVLTINEVQSSRISISSDLNPVLTSARAYAGASAELQQSMAFWEAIWALHWVQRVPSVVPVVNFELLFCDREECSQTSARASRRVAEFRWNGPQLGQG